VAISPPRGRASGVPSVGWRRRRNRRSRRPSCGLVVAIFVSAAVISGGDNGTDEFIARQAWLHVSILGAGYFISRGLAKSGSSEPYTADDNDR